MLGGSVVFVVVVVLLGDSTTVCNSMVEECKN